MEKSIKLELTAAIRDLVEASLLRPVSASEMEAHCPDCAEKIRRGEMSMTVGELEELLSE
jgi:hypothetical protein